MGGDDDDHAGMMWATIERFVDHKHDGYGSGYGFKPGSHEVADQKLNSKE